MGGLTSGRELVSRSRINLQIALKLSRKTTTRQRDFSPPLLRATISHNSSEYCAIFSKVAILEYKDDAFIQNVVYRACAEGFNVGCVVVRTFERLRVGPIAAARAFSR